MFCERCGVSNPAGRSVCLHCLGPLASGAAAEGATCAEHPAEPATGRCVTCGKLVCEACGGVVSNRGVYCIDHTPAVTTSASASPGMNPLLAGAGGAEPAAGAAARSRASMDRGILAAIIGTVIVLVFFGIAFGFPGPLRSKELPPSVAAASGGMGGGYGAGGYSTGGYGPGGYGTGGYGAPGDTSAPYSSYGGPPGGPGGPPGGPGGPPGGPSTDVPAGPGGPYGSR
jgi:hypothetical protein